jgi:nitrate/TMAO reductase-like tetraheme cytochrome c subunit
MQETLKKRDRNATIKLSIVTVLAVICCISLIMVAAERPNSPEFCARCHSMESSYDTWKETVTCNTGCLNCHTHDNTGRTLSVEIKDSNCTSIECHPPEKLVSETSKHKETISFKHETHIKEYATNLRMQCTGCHA